LSPHAIGPIIAAIAYSLVGLFVYSRKKPSPVNKSFAIMLLCVSLWNVEWIGLILAPNADFARLWGNIFRIPLLFIPPTFMHFAFLFTNPQALSRRSKRTLIVFYSISCFLVTISWTRYFHGEVITYPWGYSFKSGPLFVIFLLQFVSAILISFSYMIRGYTYVDRYQRERLKYFFFATAVSFALGSLNFLPLFGLQVYPLGSIAISIGLFIAAYSVVQHRLMDVSVFMAKGLGYVLTVLIFFVPTAIFFILLENYSFHQTDILFTAAILLMAAAISVLFSGLKQKIDKGMQKIIVKDKYKYHQILEEFSRRLVTIVDLNRLLHMLGDTIEKSMGVTNQIVFLFYPEKEIFKAAFAKGIKDEDRDSHSFKRDSSFVKWLEGKNLIVRPEIESMPKGMKKEELLREMRKLQGEVCLPLICLDRLVGFIILGHKSEEEMYYREDLDLLSLLTNQVAIAIENANLYENLKKSQMIMRRADRLASLGTLIAGLAHEIRNPLVSIKTFTQLLPERIDDEEFRNYFLTVASGEIDRLTTLINELLGFAKPTEPNLKGEDVNAIIDKMGFLVSTEARKRNITITKNLTPNPPPVMVDAEQIKQVLLNIMLNGMQAISSDQGELWIETRVVRIAREGGLEPFVQIEIRDNGGGISKENLDHIFDPFFTTRPDGSGLGLAITHQIVHEHGGFIDVESEIGKGTSFRVNFPLKAGENGGPARK